MLKHPYQNPSALIQAEIFRGPLKSEAIAAKTIIRICEHGCPAMTDAERARTMPKLAPYAAIAKRWLAHQEEKARKMAATA